MTESSVNDNNHLRLVKWPFYTGDGLLVLLAFLIVAYSAKPLSSTAISWCVISITFGALVFVAPFILEYLISIRLAKNQLQEAVDKQLQGLDTVLQELDALSRVRCPTLHKNQRIPPKRWSISDLNCKIN